MVGELPRRARQLVQEWAAVRHAELQDDWDRAIASLPLLPVPPLD
ncbi:MAG TPA: DUF4160 domain-containing protein [Gemmataceae bacterium]|nr:DUF4160 domain-containing protein [Gemmataceae bacterium]